jgi:hypothetical protein
LAETISTVDSMEEVSQRSATLSQSGHLRKDNQRSPSDGGEEHLAEQTFGPDERQDEPTFALLAELSGSIPTLFDLRGLRPKLMQSFREDGSLRGESCLLGRQLRLPHLLSDGVSTFKFSTRYALRIGTSNACV